MTQRDTMPTGYAVTLPAWFQEAQRALPTRVSDPDERARLVNLLAARNIEEGSGGPFAALVIDRDTDAVLAAGVNLVLRANLATAHAEVVALSLAQTRVGHWNLAQGSAAGPLVVVNAQPCVMCLGALIWSGAGALECSVEGAEVERITGFDEGPVPTDWRDQLLARGITVETGRLRSASVAVLQDFRERVDAGTVPLYNARSQGPQDDATSP